jgi:hypothetical protein
MSLPSNLSPNDIISNISVKIYKGNLSNMVKIGKFLFIFGRYRLRNSAKSSAFLAEGFMVFLQEVCRLIHQIEP